MIVFSVIVLQFEGERGGRESKDTCQRKERIFAIDFLFLPQTSTKEIETLSVFANALNVRLDRQRERERERTN